VQLTNGCVYGCDLVLSATGVRPNSELWADVCKVCFCFVKFNSILQTNPNDNGICVDDQFRTNVQDVYAIGDVCSANWTLSECWFQVCV
jgi:pyruvate/2-oxoglutarate dehydrogenase complex dihydrolipoamide dehydrogenase (E3) component